MDLTGNNQFNARSTYADSCGEANAVSTSEGCLDSNPLSTPDGASGRIVPFDLGTGPSNVSLNLRVTKVFGFGPSVGNLRNGGCGGGGGLGGRGLRGNQGGAGSGPATTAHRSNLSLIAYDQNIFNHENLGTPNGTLTSQFFGKSQSLVSGFFAPSTAGNKSVFPEMNFGS